MEAPNFRSNQVRVLTAKIYNSNAIMLHWFPMMINFKHNRRKSFIMCASMDAMAVLLAVWMAGSMVDIDSDGLPDWFEQALLQRFAPTLMLSVDECDALPAEFEPGRNEPRVLARNGTLYGRVFSSKASGKLELHYYHLWNRDCGRVPHNFDTEHVSVLIGARSRAAPSPEWIALYWYAAAHEDTVCDGSNGARAETIGAELGGATVWVSRGKHASFLRPELCSWGCGADFCKDPVSMPQGRIVNLGEPGAPSNGSDWIASRKWRLRKKLGSDFSDTLLAKLDGVDRPIRVAGPIPPTKALILGSNFAFTGLKEAADQSGAAVDKAGLRAGYSFGKALLHSGSAMKRVGRILGRLLGL